MHIFLPLCITVVFLLLFLIIPSSFAQTKNAKDSSNSINTQSKNNQIRDRYKEQLLNLQINPDVEKSLTIVTCYISINTEIDSVEYICPVCKAKTLYNYKQYSSKLDEIDKIKYVLDSIKSPDFLFTLDESSFCKICSPQTKEPKLCLSVKNINKPEPVVSCPVSQDDITLLVDFFAGKYLHHEIDGSLTSLQFHVPRLELLLGIRIPDIEVPQK